MQLNLGTILLAAAEARPHQVAVRLGDRELSYDQLDRAARGVATALREAGLAPGGKVALMIPNVPEFTIAYFGILYAGCTVVPLNVLLSAPEVTYHLQDSESKLLLAHPFFEAPARQGATTAGVPVLMAGGEGQETLAALAEAPPAEAIYPSDPGDTAVILYTSGTTGRPKGAELTHSNLLLNCAVVVPKLIPATPQDVALGTLPLFHSFGQTCIQNAFIALGASFTLLPRFTPQDAFEIMQRDRVTVFAGVPTMYFALLHHEEADRYDVSSLRFCFSGGAAMPVEVMRAFEKKYDVEVLEGYGLSETSPVASFTMLDRPRTPGSIGYPAWGVEMCVLDEKDRPLAAGEAGEICVVGVRDQDGSYRIVDRKKDMIIRGGFNVYPREVEEVLYAHEAILEAAVIGVPHESHGEEVKAIVVLRPGSELDPEELIGWCKGRLAAYKYPRIVELREELPKGPTGKILKRELR
jgi:long-chain acyl-CoA synthetase